MGAIPSQNIFAQDSEPSGKRLKITVGNTVLLATLIDNEATKDFLSFLPVTVKTNDYTNREKYWHLSRSLSTKAELQNTYERGDLGFWLPNNDMALFYRHGTDIEPQSGEGSPLAGTALPNRRLIVIAKISAGLEVFDRYPGSVESEIELDK
ncbi:MAG: hypothetical protein LBT25_09790 [Candidatus Symbiothrix sp.]|jgi:hypothetical protein|nr:hypothetical protein [Candidatus Symbiothrix sp.]